MDSSITESRYASRKFVIAVFLLLGATALRVFNLLDQTGLLTTWGSVMALYGTFNVAQKALTTTATK